MEFITEDWSKSEKDAQNEEFNRYAVAVYKRVNRSTLFHDGHVLSREERDLEELHNLKLIEDFKQTMKIHYINNGLAWHDPTIWNDRNYETTYDELFLEIYGKEEYAYMCEDRYTKLEKEEEGEDDDIDEYYEQMYGGDYDESDNYNYEEDEPEEEEDINDDDGWTYV
jgi:hypothetical protein